MPPNPPPHEPPGRFSAPFESTTARSPRKIRWGDSHSPTAHHDRNPAPPPRRTPRNKDGDWRGAEPLLPCVCVASRLACVCACRVLRVRVRLVAGGPPGGGLGKRRRVRQARAQHRGGGSAATPTGAATPQNPLCNGSDWPTDSACVRACLCRALRPCWLRALPGRATRGAHVWSPPLLLSPPLPLSGSYGTCRYAVASATPVAPLVSLPESVRCACGGRNPDR